MNDYGYLFATFFAMMIISFGERALPFAAGEWLQKQKWAIVVGKFLPLAIMFLLVLHSSTGAALAHGGLPIPELAAIVATLVLQWFWKNALLSIFTGTLVYVVLFNSMF